MMMASRKVENVGINTVNWEPAIYPRSKWNTDTIKRYADAIESGAEFPPIILETETNRLIDGKHRLEAYKSLGRKEIPVEWKSTPKDMSIKYFAATLSAQHGDRLSNADLKVLAREEFELNPKRDPKIWGENLGVSLKTIYNWVGDIINRMKARREINSWRLWKLGWTQEDIGERLGVDQSAVSKDMKNCNITKIHKELGDNWNEESLKDWAKRNEVGLTETWAGAISEMDDNDRLERLEIKTQPYDVWHFPGCHELMGNDHPGRIPGGLVCQVLYFMTKPGDLVVDPMAGGGTVLDACLLMGRKARGYDIDERHGRVDIEKHDLSEGWPTSTEKANLVFWDPPYFNKMDHKKIGEEGYIEGSISGMSPKEYLKWIALSFAEVYKKTKNGTRLMFLMSDWDPENDEEWGDSEGIYLWDYVRELQRTGWNVKRQIQTPLSTQQVHPDIVLKFRESKRMARLGRYLLECVK